MLGEGASTALSLTVLIVFPLIMIAISLVIFRFKECLYGETP